MGDGKLLEETSLPTFELRGDGVANNHTKADLRRIQALKNTRLRSAPPAAIKTVLSAKASTAASVHPSSCSR